MAVVAVGTVAHVHPSRARLRPILVNKLVEVETTPYIIIHLHAHLIVGHVDVGSLAHGVLRCSHASHLLVYDWRAVAARDAQHPKALAQRFKHFGTPSRRSIRLLFFIS